MPEPTLGMIVKIWPTLYKRTSAGKDQQWQLDVGYFDTIGSPPECADLIPCIRVTHGQVDGKQQVSIVRVTEGKNLGKKNETTATEQALSEAESKFLKQKDKGYSEERGGGNMELKPMLAHKLEDNRGNLSFPCFWQPKLDGVRAIAVRKGDTVSLISRQGKEHVGLTHIRNALLPIMSDGEILDGELYVHGMTFQTLVSLVKKDRPESTSVQYHIYDMLVDDVPFSERIERLTEVWNSCAECLVPVPTEKLLNTADIDSAHDASVSLGYEGIMLRVNECLYRRGYRSHDLLKVKAFMDDDFEIISVANGKGKFEDQAIFTLKTSENVLFECVCRGTREQRRQYLQDAETLIGKLMTVRFFEWTTSTPPVPRFPVGIGVRFEQ